MERDKDLDKAAIGKRIAEMRKKGTEEELPQRKLAHDVGIHFSTISRIERGHRSPSYLQAAKLARHFGVSINYLMMGEKEKCLPTSF